MPRFDRRLFILIATLACGSVLLGGQQTPAPTFRTGVEAVQLTVIVTDSDGKPVSGLTKDDFEILENNVARPVTTFAAVDIPIEQTERRLGEPDVLSNDGPPGRVYAIALDAMSVTSAFRAHAFLRAFIEKYLGPNDTAAVMLLTRGPGESGQEFTSNKRLLLAAIDKFTGDAPDEWSTRMRQRNFVGDFRSLMSFLAALRGGRKAVIFVSEGIPVNAYDVVEAPPARFHGLFSNNEPDFVDALSFATRNNIAVYPIDPQGLTTEVTTEESFTPVAADERQQQLDNRILMGGLAAVTGGFALTGSNNYATALERLVRENSTYYLMAFNSGLDERDGRYVPIKVRVKRPGLQVRSADGYVAPRGKPAQTRRPSTVLASVWDAVASAVTTSGVPMRVSAAPFKGEGKNATVAITLEIAASKLNLVLEDGAYRGVLEILFAVTDVKQKKRGPIWRHRAALALKPETYERVSHGALRVVSQLPLPAGRYQLRASAGGATVAGSVVYDLDVPDFRHDFSLSGVALTSSQARETFTFSPQARIDVALPGPPTTAREFSRDDTLTLFAEAYEDRRTPHTITFAMELRDEAGRVLDTHVTERKAANPTAASVYAFAPTLALDNVPSGRYVIHVDASSSLDTRKSVIRDVPISVR